MFINLDKAIHEKKMNKTSIAELLDVSYGTVCAKINGTSTFTMDEALLIHEKYFEEYDFKYLFKKIDLSEESA